MFVPRKRPGRRDNESVDLVRSREFLVELFKAKVVANAETKMQTAERKARERIACSKSHMFFHRRDRIQISLTIFRDDVALRINQNLGIVNPVIPRVRIRH